MSIDLKFNIMQQKTGMLRRLYSNNRRFITTSTNCISGDLFLAQLVDHWLTMRDANVKGIESHRGHCNCLEIKYALMLQ